MYTTTRDKDGTIRSYKKKLANIKGPLIEERPKQTAETSFDRSIEQMERFRQGHKAPLKVKAKNLKGGFYAITRKDLNQKGNNYKRRIPSA